VNDPKSAPMHVENAHKLPDAQKRRRGEKIGENLRKIYEDVTQEPVPDAFFKLLEAADKRQPNPPAKLVGEESDV